jgi:periplasmic divalent cation tolerance protein
MDNRVKRLSFQDGKSERMQTKARYLRLRIPELSDIFILDSSQGIAHSETGWNGKEAYTMSVCFAYMTAGDMDEARRISRDLVEKRHAACVNILAGMLSVFRWEGVIQEDSEVVLIAKTTASELPSLVERVKMLHSYETPCVIGFPADGGNGDFIRWIETETGKGDGRIASSPRP